MIITQAPTNLPTIPKVTLGRSGIVTTKFGVGTAYWPVRQPYETVVEIFRAAFAAGVRHVDTAPLYGTEEVVGRAMADAGHPADLNIATKCCAYFDDLGIVYRDYSNFTVYRSVERSLKRLKTDRLAIVHIHDVDLENLDQIGAKDGALRALVDLRSQGVIRSISMATVSLDCLRWAVDTGEFDQVQIYHTYTLLNNTARRSLIPAAREKNMGVINCAPYAGYILQSGAVPNALYNYYPATPEVIEATKRLEAAAAAKGVTLPEAAVAYSYLVSDVDVTIIGTSSVERLYERLRVFGTRLTRHDVEAMAAVAGGPFPVRSSWERNPINSERTALL